MSSTRYSRDLTLRIDAEERHALYVAVMRDIQRTSMALASAAAAHSPLDVDARHLRHLRSLLERLSQ